jgi:hypothetical protein
MWRTVIDVERPEARVTGADPAYALQRSGIGETCTIITDLGQ